MGGRWNSFGTAQNKYAHYRTLHEVPNLIPHLKSKAAADLRGFRGSKRFEKT